MSETHEYYCYSCGRRHRGDAEEWTEADEQRARELREADRDRGLTDDERSELAALRQRETVEAFRRRREFFKRIRAG